MLIEQCFSNLPWFKQVTEIAYEYGIDLMKANEMKSNEWKNYVKKCAATLIKEKLIEMTHKTKHYQEMITEKQMMTGRPQEYMKLKRNISMAIIRCRTNTMDPKPRKPEWEKPYQCKFCLMKSQSSRHYVLECKMTEKIFINDEDRIHSWQLVKSLEGHLNEIEEAGRKIQLILKLLKNE